MSCSFIGMGLVTGMLYVLVRILEGYFGYFGLAFGICLEIYKVLE